MKSAYGSGTKVTEGKVIWALAATHYLVHGTFGATNKVGEPSRFAIDTGDGFNIINQSALPPWWVLSLTLQRLPQPRGLSLLRLLSSVLRIMRFG